MSENKSENKKEKLVIKEDTLEKVLSLDCRKERDIRRLKKSLMRLPFMKSKEDLNTDTIEAFIERIESKYPVHLGYVTRRAAGSAWYTGMVKGLEGKWLKTVYGLNMWEVYAKTLFFMYYYVEKERRKLDDAIKNTRGKKK